MGKSKWFCPTAKPPPDHILKKYFKFFIFIIFIQKLKCQINGLRFCDKSKPKENSVQYRLEVWTESDYYQSESLEAHNKSQKDIEKIIKESGLDVKHSYKPHVAQD